ncbi:hypothetical protein CLI85_13705 [Tannerella forsythia]|nr:hypothetical protein CLI85_13705 [Tannerella forsythia]
MEFFQLSARARGLCCKNGVVLHKTYLAICSDANKSVREGRKTIHSKKERFMPRRLQFTAWGQSY